MVKRRRSSSSNASKGKAHGVKQPKENLIDGISNELLLCILSLLPIKEAARMSILSKRWRYTWTPKARRVTKALSHSQKRKVKKAIKSKEDRISSLPDEMIHNILQFLPTKEAGRTSVLSKRWIDVWSYTPVLDFHDPRVSQLLKVMSRDKFFIEESPYYQRWVYDAVRLYKGIAFEELKVRFYSHENDLVFITELLFFAMGKGVKRLEVDLYNYNYLVDFRSNSYNLPKLFGCINSLTSLRLKYVGVSGETIEHYLRGCRSLEYLHVEDSTWLKTLSIGEHVLKLKHLEIINCFGLDKIEINAPNLLSFKHFGSRISLISSNDKALSLSEISFGGKKHVHVVVSFLGLSSYSSQLEALTLNFHGSLGIIGTCNIPIYSRLKRLQLRIFPKTIEDIEFYGTMLQACPVLHRLKLELDWSVQKPNLSRHKFWTKKCPHYHLKVLEIVGYIGNCIDQKYAIYTIRNVPGLEKMIIKTCSLEIVGTKKEFEDSRERRSTRRRARSLLRQWLEPHMALIVS